MLEGGGEGSPDYVEEKIMTIMAITARVEMTGINI